MSHLRLVSDKFIRIFFRTFYNISTHRLIISSDQNFPQLYIQQF